MRMWMIHPSLMCRKHLLGEHAEIHKFRHIFEKGQSIENRVKYPAQIVPLRMQERHDDLVKEMLARGYKHKSPYTQPCLDEYPVEQVEPRFSIWHNVADIVKRCPECRNRILPEK